ncbi:MAG: nucleotide exchange factor GrpE [Clostridia bacterium]|nr:nucleotide exchange factor GrpE [Clostridia bacterium]
MANETIEKNEEVIEEAQTEDTPVNETDAKIEELEKELAATKEAHIRTLAEYDNYRKRSVKEKESIYADAKVSCLSELLPVLDNFDRAMNVQQADAETYKKGMEMINTSFIEILKKLGVEAFGEKGEEFDPNFHNAVMSVEDDELGENVIAEVFNKGYKLGDKVLRHAVVKVAN